MRDTSFSRTREIEVGKPGGHGTQQTVIRFVGVTAPVGVADPAGEQEPGSSTIVFASLLATTADAWTCLQVPSETKLVAVPLHATVP